MQIKKLSNKEWDTIIELYIENRKEFDDIITIEEFAQQYCHRCDDCGNIICILKGCGECKDEEIDKDWEYFDSNKEHYVYGL